MNPLENLEAMLRGFQPRPPSPRVRAALFPPAATATAAAEPAPALPLHAWFAPLAAAAVVLLSAATLWSPSSTSSATAITLASIPGAWDPALVQVQRNALPRTSFRSTTSAAVASSFGSLLLRQTNVLTR